jgi:hypothetical protein
MRLYYGKGGGGWLSWGIPGRGAAIPKLKVIYAGNGWLTILLMHEE